MITAKGNLYFTTPFHSSTVLNKIKETIINNASNDNVKFINFNLVKCEHNTSCDEDFSYYVQIHFEFRSNHTLFDFMNNNGNFKRYLIDKINKYTSDMDFKYKYMDEFELNEVFDQNTQKYKEVYSGKRTIFILNEGN